MRTLFPSRALALLLGIGLLDLVATALLSARGLVEERNPAMAPLLAHGVAPFVAVKTATLLAAWLLLVRQERRTMRRACLWGSALYAALPGYRVRLIGP